MTNPQVSAPRSEPWRWPEPVCWCGWAPAKPRHFFASHLMWHIDIVRRKWRHEAAEHALNAVRRRIA